MKTIHPFRGGRGVLELGEAADFGLANFFPMQFCFLKPPPTLCLLFIGQYIIVLHKSLMSVKKSVQNRRFKLYNDVYGLRTVQRAQI